MPKPLPQRFRSDCVYEFRRAAHERFQDGVAAAESGRRTATIYLSGYAAEMTFKAAYFRLLGFADLMPITIGDLANAKSTAKALGITWIGNLHSVYSWSQLIVATRGAIPGLAYADPAFGIRVLAEGAKLQSLWNETIRYHGNVAYLHEVAAVSAATQWLLMNTRLL